MHLVIPKSFNDAQDVADKFKDSIPVIINLQGSETDLSKRLIDFASGLTYALDGGMQRIADKVFLLTPRNVELSSEERARLIEKGFFNQCVDSGAAACILRAMQIGLHRLRQHGTRARPRLGRAGAVHRLGLRRAQALAPLVGGEAVGSNRELAERADVVVLATSRRSSPRWPRRSPARPRRSSRSSRAPRRPRSRGLPGHARCSASSPTRPWRSSAGVLAFAVPDAAYDDGARTRSCTSASGASAPSSTSPRA